MNLLYWLAMMPLVVLLTTGIGDRAGEARFMHMSVAMVVVLFLWGLYGLIGGV